MYIWLNSVGGQGGEKIRDAQQGTVKQLLLSQMLPLVLHVQKAQTQGAEEGKQQEGVFQRRIAK